VAAVDVGLVGAGPWAQLAHGPVLAVRAHGTAAGWVVDCATTVSPGAFATLRRELAEAVLAGAGAATAGHPLDVHRGLHLQRVIAAAEADFRTCGSEI
jgi:hypothetical protein